MAPTVYVMEPPEGQVRTLIDLPSSGGGVLPAGVATTIISLIAVCLRVFTRKHVVKGVLGADDCLSCLFRRPRPAGADQRLDLCIAGLVFSFVFLGVTLALLDLGAGNHMWDIPMAQYSPKFWQTTVGGTLVYSICIGCPKLSVLTFYLRISPDKFVRRAVHTLMSLVCTYTLAFILLIIFRCRPVSSGWDLTIQGQCIDKTIPELILAICNISVDICILCLPARIVQPLQIPTRQKISLAILFATGGFVFVVSIRRITVTCPLLHTVDYTWDLPRQLMLSFLEVSGGLVCASVPALKPFCMRYVSFLVHPRIRTGEKRKSHVTGSNSYEMPSRRDRDEEYLQDEETRLWTKLGDKGAALESFDTRQDTESLESITDKTSPEPAQPEPVLVGFTTKRCQSVGGIKITRETVITYGPTDSV
ncbi:hypothetical protein F66182_6668 [Fusarium sp. NRRL 66182]|nr:hypothetical protein F66182_6668 [Fusarium sp. NRRL 66182]